MKQTIKQQSENREQRAKAILEMGELQIIDEFTYLVPSQTDSNKKYRVSHIDSYSCECPDFRQRCKNNGLYCKHIKAILLFEKVKVQYEVEPEVTKEIELIIEKPTENHCPYCTSDKLIKRGVRLTKLGEKQRYGCLACKKRFVLSAIPKIKGNVKLVCLAMDCFYRGLSYHDIPAQFKDFYGLSLSHITIRNWVLKFSETMEKYAKTLQPKNVGNIWNADETLVRTKKGNRKKGADYEYQWNVMDKETKFLLASHLTGHARGSREAQEVMTEAYAQNMAKSLIKLLQINDLHIKMG
jgi:transposase-like protein